MLSRYLTIKAITRVHLGEFLNQSCTVFWPPGNGDYIGDESKPGADEKLTAEYYEDIEKVNSPNKCEYVDANVMKK